MPTVAKKKRPNKPWKPLQPIILHDPLLYHLAKDHLHIMSGTTNLLINCVQGLYRPHHLGCPKRLNPLRICGKVLFCLAMDFKKFDDQKWELYKKIGQVDIFAEAPPLEFVIARVKNDAYNRDDINDSFAFIDGHIISVSYSVKIIIRAFLDEKPKIRLSAAAALGYFIRHRDHRCFTDSENFSLDEACQVLKKMSKQFKDKEVAKVYRDSLKRLSS
ncbi:MAG: hypothetical protein JW914_05415 [Syntrophaceae bacterium]|nr:hypothetical protein [Syntrophaceae bacterium]